MRHHHYPTNIAHRYAVPFENGERSTCGQCGKAIVFVEGFELRRSYWRLTTARDNATLGVDTTAAGG